MPLDPYCESKNYSPRVVITITILYKYKQEGVIVMCLLWYAFCQSHCQLFHTQTLSVLCASRFQPPSKPPDTEQNLKYLSKEYEVSFPGWSKDSDC